MYRDCRVFLADIIDSIGEIRSYVAGLSYDSFSQDPKTVDAVRRLVSRRPAG